MAHTDVHQEGHGLAESRPRLLYGLNDKPPFKDALFVGLQHVCAIFIPVCTPGLGVTFLPEALHSFPPGVQSVLESGIATGSICALVLNMVVPRLKEEALAAKQEPIAAESTVPMEPK